MIKVQIYRDKNNIIWAYDVKGHANFKKHGEDIVCAGVSALSQTTLLSLVEVVGIDENKLDYKIDDSGFLSVRLPEDLDENKLDESQILLRSFEIGVKSIIESYGKYVTLKCREV